MTSDARPLSYLPLAPDATGPSELPTEAGTLRYPAGPSRALETGLFVVDLAGTALAWLATSAWLVPAPTWWGRLTPGLVASAVMLLAMRALHLYRSRRCARRSEEVGRTAIAGLCGAAAFVAVQAASRPAGAQGLAAAAAAVSVVGLARWEYGRFVRAQRAHGRHLRGVVLVGTSHDTAALATMLAAEPELGYVVTGVVGGDAGEPRLAGTSPPSVADIPRLATVTGAGGILIVPFGLTSETVRAAIEVASAARLHVQVWSGLLGVGSRRLRSVPVSGEPFFYVEPTTPARWQLAVKRAMDIAGAVVGLALGAPALLVGVLLVLADGGAPVLHRGVRVGRGGEPFVAYKLRTMIESDRHTPAQLAALNERTDGPLFKASNDPRVTRVGKLLRATSVDELPQLWNVLNGTMSLVGPRPALPTEVVAFDDELQRRHSVRPGVTGLWQVEARRNPSFHAYRRLDLRYVDDWSLGLDVAILAATFPAVVGQAAGELRRRRARVQRARRRHPSA